MSNSNISDDSVTSTKAYMFVAMAAMAGLILVLVNSISAKPEKVAAAKPTNVAEHIAPAGKVGIAGAVMNAIIPTASAEALTGKSVYESGCSACHATGVAGSPKMGDKDAWKARIAAGNETLYKNSINGFQGKKGVMPPKGGFSNLSDAEVKAAVDYMVKSSK